jgi:hypothetical protein
MSLEHINYIIIVHNELEPFLYRESKKPKDIKVNKKSLSSRHIVK